MLTSQALKEIETQALAMLRAKDSSRGAHAALKAFVPSCARLGAQLAVVEAKEAVKRAADNGQPSLLTPKK